MKLISMTDFVLEQTELLYESNPHKLIHKIVNYAQFLKQPLTLGMFVPCDENGNVLEEPKKDYHFMYANGQEFYPHQIDEYNLLLSKAKEKILFKGFDEVGGVSVAKAICQTYKTIESLTDKKIPLISLALTESAIKQIGL